MEPFKSFIDIPFDLVNTVKSWEEFKTENQRLLEFLKKHKEESGSFVSIPRYRGQNDSNWKLETTLERASKKSNFQIHEYFKIAQETHKKLQSSYIPKQILQFQAQELLKSFENLTNNNLHPNGLEILSDLAFLRHHGFPSPLLDWSLSSNIAAFFAFEQNSNSEYVSIYVLIEYLNYGKMVNRLKPKIEGIGTNIKVHPRHEKQESEYTACLVEIDNQQYFTSHDPLLTNNTKAQDVTLKFNIPAIERSKVLNELRNNGITLSYLMVEQSPQMLLHEISTDYF